VGAASTQRRIRKRLVLLREQRRERRIRQHRARLDLMERDPYFWRTAEVIKTEQAYRKAIRDRK
jgi:hypothetical protein